MADPANSGAARHILSVTQLEPGLLELQLESPPRDPPSWRVPDIGDEPGWSLAVDRIVGASFAGRDVCFVAYQPPIEWSDLELEHLTYPIETTRAGELDFKFGFVERVSSAVLAAAAASQDFRHTGLLIAAIPEHPRERIARFVAALSRASAHFLPWKESIRLPVESQMAAFKVQIRGKIRCNEEFMECVNDGEQINWYHPSPAAFNACRSELEVLAAQQGWQLELRHL